MNELRIQEGGHPFLADDLMFVQAATKNSLNGILTMFENNGIGILSGARITSVLPDTVFSSGYLFTAGEIFEVIGGVVSAVPGDFMIKLDETNDPVIDPVLYGDSTLKSVHKIRKVKIVNNSITSGPYLGSYNDANKFRFETSWNDFQLINSFTNGNLFIANPSYIKAGLWVHFRGAIRLDASFSAPILPFAELPEEYRPSQNLVIPAMIASSWNSTSKELVNYELGYVRIQTDGLCYVDSTKVDTAANKSISLDSIKFKIS